MQYFIDFLRYEDKEYSMEILKRYAKYLDENIFPSERCQYCKYDTCSENDDCYDGILEKLLDKM